MSPSSSPSSSTSSEHLLMPEVEVEIHENERAWIGGGFSKKGLLPNDRGRFSTPDGTLSWKSIEEASEALLDKGWTYIKDTDFQPILSAEQEYFELSNGNGDENGESRQEEGWHYARDFTNGAIQNSKPKRNVALHWVRYRRLMRVKKFDPSQFLPSEIYTKCNYCDSEVKGALSMKLLEVLAFITLVHNGSDLTAVVALPWKTKLLELIDIGSEASKIYEEHASANITSLHRKLEAFAESESNNPRNVFSKISNVKFKLRYNESLTPGFAERCADLSSSNIFPKVECDALAGLIIRHLDPKFQLHCDKANCGKSCMFAIVPCPNDECDVQISRKHLKNHSQHCPYEIIPCPLGCGDKYPRNMKDKHKAEICPLREVACPFANVGCTTRVLARDLPEHVGSLETTNSHLLLAVNRMMEYQTVIKNLNTKVKLLEDDTTSLKRLFATYKTQTDKEHKDVTNKFNSLSKKVNHMENSSRKEFQKIKHDQEKHLK